MVQRFGRYYYAAFDTRLPFDLGYGRPHLRIILPRCLARQDVRLSSPHSAGDPTRVATLRKTTPFEEVDTTTTNDRDFCYLHH